MNTILIYLHLAVILSIGIILCGIDNKWVKAFGVLNGIFALVYAYGYAVYSMWQVCAR